MSVAAIRTEDISEIKKDKEMAKRESTIARLAEHFGDAGSTLVYRTETDVRLAQAAAAKPGTSLAFQMVVDPAGQYAVIKTDSAREALTFDIKIQQLRTVLAR